MYYISIVLLNIILLGFSSQRLKAQSSDLLKSDKNQSKSHYNLNLSYIKSNIEKEGRNNPIDLPNLITFWDFQEETGNSRISKGPYTYALEEMNGPIKRVKDGVFGLYCADIEWGQWFRIERKDCPALNIYGKSEVSMVAWIKRESEKGWQFIAGMWDEGRHQGTVTSQGEESPARQYALFISGTSQNNHITYIRSPAMHQTHGYISTYGGETPGYKVAFDYATGKTIIKKDRWYMIAFTYNHSSIKVYVNGKLDKNKNCNPFLYEGDIYERQNYGADFTVALRRVASFSSYPDGIPKHTNLGFDGRIGGLAVFDRALSSDEIKRLYLSTLKNRK